MEDAKNRIENIEAAMMRPDFWNDKDRAQQMIREMQELKDALEGAGKYDKGEAIITILAGAGGDDAEDFAHMLYEMYQAYLKSKGWESHMVHQNENDHGGYRNITFEAQGKQAYGTLKNESGVHRLVRISPFNAKSLRHTSFALVEVLPKLKATDTEIVIPESDVRFDFMRSGGAGGQNVNKRETAVRVVHIPTNISVHADGERSQLQNKEKALEILKGKLFRLKEAEMQEKKEAMQIAGTQEIAWGNQIRSYVLHPYKMVKDHRTEVEVHNVDAVLEEGDIEEFIQAEKGL